MRRFRPLTSIFLVLAVYTGTVFACPFRKLVDEQLSAKKERARTKFSTDPIFDPAPPFWEEDPAKKKQELDQWEEQILKAAEAQWRALGVSFTRIPYKKGTALKVSEFGTSPLNILYSNALKNASKANYPFQIVFSPRSLVREWPEEQLNYLIGGSFNSGKTTIHLPFASLRSAELNSTVHHEFLHAIFDYLRQTGKPSAFHGQFHSRDKENPMWKGSHYTEYMSLEELATFPVNLRLYLFRLKELQAEPSSTSRATGSVYFMKEIWGHSLTNAVNANHARNALGHIIRHAKDQLKDVRASATVFRPLWGSKWQIEGVFKFGNIEYTTSLQEEEIKDLIPEIESQNETEVGKMERALKIKISKRMLEHLERQYGMAVKASEAADALMEALIQFRGKKLSDAELEKLSDLLMAPRTVTLPYIQTSPN